MRVTDSVGNSDASGARGSADAGETEFRDKQNKDKLGALEIAKPKGLLRNCFGSS